MLLTLIDGQEPAPNVLALAHSLDLPVEAVLHVTSDGADADDADDVAGHLTDELAKQGVATLHLIRHELLAGYAPEAFGEALAQLVAHLRPAAVLAAGTDRGTEIMAHAAARARLPLATNCVAVTGGDPWLLTRARGGGMLLEEAELTAPVKLATVAQGAAAPADAQAVDNCAVREFVPELLPELARTRVVERTAGRGGITLATAPVIVSGGRGVGSAEGYAVLEELAALLGGAVGCSRVATNNGWRPHSDQVGLTGTKVAPDLYIACGISGATQHWVGCTDSKAILAVNTDPEAPMVARATYAVIGDVHEVLPAVVAEIRARSS
ncbi:electron transfer flavoprotein subunit alpha/FixB family protein [Qaidamihabitans albus]|uniref:electron transfer flavoprotein subunit alpha/FixB family protein n=1 Tax=Qaidamihabitans albus TaxID=2795733 RepID=UPI0018F27001|nr:electron transfer flavoprotein subunit alpha/FixB family protein [Qaidamihabitans albus]